MPTLFTGKCSRCWPAFCKCPPSADEIEKMKGDIYLLDRELQRENRRASEFTGVIRILAGAIISARDARVADGGFDNLPPDMHQLAQEAEIAMGLLAEDRNQDRVAELYAKFNAATANDGDDNG